MSEVLAYTIADATKVSGLGRSTLYEAIGAGKLEARKAGGRTLVMAESLKKYLASLPAAKIHVVKKVTARQAANDSTVARP